MIQISKSADEKKNLLWRLIDDDENDDNVFKIHEFRVCDCYLDWILHFQLRNKETNFSFTTAFFDEVTLTGNDIAVNCDTFVFFGKISIVCCERALYYFSYKKDIPHEKFYDESVVDQFDCRCLYLLEGKFFFLSLCISCQFNLLKNSSKTFYKIKND